MIKLTENELKELMLLCEGYTSKLLDYPILSDKYHEIKNSLDNQFSGLDIWQEKDIIHSELDLGNVIIEDNILTCIYDNKLHKFKMTVRKARNGEFIYITNASEYNPFKTKYIGRCFKVSQQPTSEMLEWVVDHVIINIEDLDTGWCLYDSQYVVLDELS